MSDSSPDYHAVLGLSQGAGPEEARAAFRALAKRCHPDAPGGNARRFAAITEARQALCHNLRKSVRSERAGLVSRFWAMAKTPPPVPVRGANIALDLHLSLEDALAGARRRVSLPDGRAVEVQCPPGCASGDQVRLRGMGQPGQDGGPAGDALVHLHIRAHRRARLEGRDIHLTHWLDLSRLRKGGCIEVPTPHGPLKVQVPPLSRKDQVLRLKGRGLPARGSHPVGHLLITLKARQSPGLAEALGHFTRLWARPLRRSA